MRPLVNQTILIQARLSQSSLGSCVGGLASDFTEGLLVYNSLD